MNSQTTPTMTDARPCPEARGEAEQAAEPLLCPECGHDIDRHVYDYDRAIDLCDECPDTERCPTPLPSQVARALIEQAVKQPRSSK